MAPASRCLAEEGVLIQLMLLTSFGEDRTGIDKFYSDLGNVPTRALAENLATLQPSRRLINMGFKP